MPQNINWDFQQNTDIYPPVITFSNSQPESKMIIEGTGSVHVRIKDSNPIGTSINIITSAGFFLTSESLGEIDYSSFVEVAVNDVEFDVINISASGDVIVSASDIYDNSTTAADGKWYFSCVDPLDDSLDNNRLINLTNFLPQHLVESEVFDFMKFFQDYENTMYEVGNDCEGHCHISILKKIERLTTLHDADTIDEEYIQFLASFMGYDGLDVNRTDIGSFRVGDVDADDIDNLTPDQICTLEKQEGEYLRFVVRNLPNWYRIKTTDNAVKIALFSFGIIGELETLFTNDYDENWLAEDKKDGVDISTEFGVNRQDYFPSPHFVIVVDTKITLPNWINNIDRVKDAVNSIRPINTVFEGINSRYDMDLITVGLNGNGAQAGVMIKNNIQVAWNKPSANL